MPVAPSPVVPPRRTQVERREATRAALLAAALDQLVADGLGGFTTTEVCRRSGLSQGALFKHFATKDLLLAAVAEHLFDELRTEFEREFTALGPGDRSTRAGVELLWRQMFDPRLAAAFDLYTAARTDAGLQACLEPVVAAHVERIHELAVELVPEIDPDRLRVTVEVAILAMQGLVLNQMALPDAVQQQRLHDLLDVVALALTNGTTP